MTDSSLPDPLKPPLIHARDALISEIAKHNDRYHNESSPSVSDAEYDALKRDLMQVELGLGETHGISALIDSPTQTAGAPLPMTARSVKHVHPMLSLGNIYDEAGILAFVIRMETGHRQRLAEDHFNQAVNMVEITQLDESLAQCKALLKHLKGG